MFVNIGLLIWYGECKIWDIVVWKKSYGCVQILCLDIWGADSKGSQEKKTL